MNIDEHYGRNILLTLNKLYCLYFCIMINLKLDRPINFHKIPVKDVNTYSVFGFIYCFILSNLLTIWQPEDWPLHRAQCTITEIILSKIHHHNLILRNELNPRFYWVEEPLYVIEGTSRKQVLAGYYIS